MVDWGSVPDWFSAVGTVGAVWVALDPKRVKLKIIANANYAVPEVFFTGYSLSAINRGSQGINISRIGFDIRRVTGGRELMQVSTDFNGGIVQPTQEFKSGINPVHLYNSLLQNNKKDKKNLKVRVFVQDNLGKFYYGKYIKIDMAQLKTEAEEFATQHSDFYEINKSTYDTCIE